MPRELARRGGPLEAKTDNRGFPSVVEAPGHTRGCRGRLCSRGPRAGAGPSNWRMRHRAGPIADSYRCHANKVLGRFPGYGILSPRGNPFSRRGRTILNILPLYPQLARRPLSPTSAPPCRAPRYPPPRQTLMQRLDASAERRRAGQEVRVLPKLCGPPWRQVRTPTISPCSRP